MRRRLLVLGALLLGSAAGCPFSFTNDEHCAAQAGDATCAAADPSAPYCALDGCGLYDEVSNRSGCVSEQPSDLSCYSPCGGKQNAEANSDCEGGTGSTTMATDTETGGPTSTSNTTVDETESAETTDGCGENEWLEDGLCVACGDGPLCETDDPAERDACGCDFCMPAFDAGDVHVGCSATHPNCVDGACVSLCLLPTDCPATTGCEHGSGRCGVIEPDRAFYVDPDGSDNNPGGEETPFATIAKAIEEAEEEASEAESRPTTIFLADGIYETSVDVANKRVILRPWGEASPELRSPDTEPVFVVRGSGNGVNSYLNVVGLRFVGSSGPVVRVEPNGRFLADGVEMRDNGAAIIIERGNAFLRNSIVAGTTGLVLEVREQADFGVVASTLVENGPAPWFDCQFEDDDLGMTIRDSIIGNFDDSLGYDDLSMNCVLGDQGNTVRTVEGELVVMERFDANDRLTSDVDSAYEIDATMFCTEVTDADDLPSSSEPCRPIVDIDGEDRLVEDAGNWVGASLPPPAG